MSLELYYPGLEGVIVGETTVATLEGGLLYRGYRIEELASQSTFPEVAYILLHDELPSQEQFADFLSILAEETDLPQPVEQYLSTIPMHVSAIDALRTGVSMLGNYQPHSIDDPGEHGISQAISLMARIPLLIGAWYAGRMERPALRPEPELSFAANLFYLLRGVEPSDLQERALDLALMMAAEHDFNASTFAARVVASTGSDLYSAIVAAIGALKGPLHGGAGERVLDVLDAVPSAEEASDWLAKEIQAGRRIMGFGHRVYKTVDPRAEILKLVCAQLAEAQGDDSLERKAAAVEAAMWEQKRLPDNMDWQAARVYHYLGLSSELFVPLFLAARVVGWSAHVIEQAESNRLMHPRSRYRGAMDLEFIPLGERG